LIFAVL